MPDYIVPKDCRFDETFGFMHFGPDLSAAEDCQDSLEKLNPGKSFYISDSLAERSSSCSCSFSWPESDYYIKEGPIDGCQPVSGGIFDSWDAEDNRYMASECARELNLMERVKPAQLRVKCYAVNIGGCFVDNYQVFCK